MSKDRDLPQYNQWKKLKLNFRLDKETIELQNNVVKKLKEMQIDIHQFIQDKLSEDKKLNVLALNMQHFYNTQFWLNANQDYATEIHKTLKFILGLLNDEANQHSLLFSRSVYRKARRRAALAYEEYEEDEQWFEDLESWNEKWNEARRKQEEKALQKKNDLKEKIKHHHVLCQRLESRTKH